MFKSYVRKAVILCSAASPAGCSIRCRIQSRIVKSQKSPLISCFSQFQVVFSSFYFIIFLDLPPISWFHQFQAVFLARFALSFFSIYRLYHSTISFKWFYFHKCYWLTFTHFKTLRCEVLNVISDLAQISASTCYYVFYSQRRILVYLRTLLL